MTDKSQQFVGGDKFPKVSRQWLEDHYPERLTDKQWDILVDYCSGSIDEDEYQADLLYAIKNIDRLEAEYESYSLALSKVEKGETK